MPDRWSLQFRQARLSSCSITSSTGNISPSCGCFSATPHDTALMQREEKFMTAGDLLAEQYRSDPYDQKNAAANRSDDGEQAIEFL